MKLRPAYAASAALLTVVLAAVLAPAAVDATQLPSAREVVDRHIEAVGGRAAIEQHTSSKASGSLEILGQGLVGEMTVYGAAPNKMMIIVNFPSAGVESRQGFDGSVGWASDPMMGERLLQGGELTQMADEALYMSDLYPEELYASMETIEEVEFGGMQTYKIRLVYVSGREAFEYFDIESGRLVGNEMVQESAMGAMNVTTVVGDYQDFGGIMVPTSILQELGPGQMVQVTINGIEFDNVDPSTFDLPASIQALLR